MPNYLLKISYDGSAYHGYQIQKNLPTVQGEMQKALSKIFNQNIELIGCSRTDVGVHAREYICNFKAKKQIKTHNVVLGLNSNLPLDIAVKSCDVTTDDFYATRSVKSKIYSYHVLTSDVRDPLNINRVWHYPKNLDIEKMLKAKQYFLGEVDFTSFMASGGYQQQMKKHMYSIDIFNQNDLYIFTYHANGYLYNMVRILTGTFVDVGRGYINYKDIPDIIAAKDRTKAGQSAPPQGLYLEKVIL